MFKYNKYTFHLTLEREIAFRSPASFIFRNNIGLQLRKLTCILRRSECGSCIINKTCIYSSVFETTIDKDNEIIRGRDKASHPYIVYSDTPTGVKTKQVNIDITLIGVAVDYFPYILLALINTGKSGILSQRIHFDIDNVLCRGQYALNKKGDYCENIDPLIWDWDKNLDGENNKSVKDLELALLSPLRVKYKGKYISRLTYKDIIFYAAQRLNMLDNLFGNGSLLLNGLIADLVGFMEKASIGKELSSDLKWNDYSRFSARQNQSMRLGGLMGIIRITGTFSGAELSLLKAAELFHIGKNTSFGLGRIEIHAHE